MDSTGRHAVTFRGMLGAAICGGILTGAAHAAVLGWRHLVLHRFTESSREFVWIAPVTYAICFSLALLPLLALRSVKPAWVTRSRVLSWIAGLAAFGLLLLIPRVHPLAWLAVAIGIGLRTGALADARAAVWLRRLYPAAGLVAVLCAITGASHALRPKLRERQLLAREPFAPASAPNVLLLILDTVRAVNLSAYGYARPTSPFLEALAREGVLFEHAHSPAAWTLPSHASMMTGRWAVETGTSYLTPTNPGLPTLAEVLTDAGYVTAGFIANAGWAGHESGIGKGFARYVTHPIDRSQLLWSSSLTQTRLVRGVIQGAVRRSPRSIWSALRAFDLSRSSIRPGDTRNAGEIADLFLAWRQKIGDRHPYFAMLNMMDSHDPYAPPAPWNTRFDGGAKGMDRYDGGIAYMDSVLSHIIGVLRDRGELDRTVLIVTSDHGELFGEHGLRGHGNSVYLNVTRVPLIVRFPPRVGRGERRNDLVSLRELAATVTDLAASGASAFPGTSWFSPVRGRTILTHASAGVRQPVHFRTARGPVNGVMNDEWQLITNPDGSRELYEWRRDTATKVNRIGDALADSVVSTLTDGVGESRVNGVKAR